MKAAPRSQRKPTLIEPRTLAYFVPPLLSFVAGYIDVVTFVALFGLYVAQVTGSFVVVGAQIVEQDTTSILIKILAIPVFLLSAVLTVFLCYWLARHRRSQLGWSLILETVLLGAFYICAVLSPLKDPNGAWTVAASIFALAAMGVQSALVRLLMRGVASTNVMTTNTSMLGIDAAEFLIAWWERKKWPRSSFIERNYKRAYKSFYGLLQITLGFIAGAAVGAVAESVAGIHALVGPIAVVAMLTLWSFRND